MSFFAFIYAMIVAILGSVFSFESDSYQPVPSDSFTLDLSGSESPEVLSVTVEGADGAYVSNLYNVHVLHTDVVGLFGCPVQVSADEYDGASLTFRYDETALGAMPAENLLVLWYDENRGFYLEREPELDTVECTASVRLTTGGAYMLVDRYMWLGVWGADVEEYAHDIVFTNSDHTPEFSVTIPGFIELSQTAYDSGLTGDGRSFVQLCGTKQDADISYIIRYYNGEDCWQSECDGWAEQIRFPYDNTVVQLLEYSLPNGAQAKLYRWNYDDSSRGGPVSVSVILQIKVSDDEFISISAGLDPENTPDSEAVLQTCIDYLCTFEWKGELSSEAYVAAEPWVAGETPAYAQETAVQLVDYTYDADVPNFTIKLADCVTPEPRSNGMMFEDENGFSYRWLMWCNQSDDIYYDLKYYSGENMWDKRLLTEEFIFNIEGESHTVEDVSSVVGCDAEIYVLRFADTGKVESEHRMIYLFGFYRLSDTELVSVRCDLWADVESEYMELLLDSLRSFRFAE